MTNIGAFEFYRFFLLLADRFEATFPLSRAFIFFPPVWSLHVSSLQESLFMGL